MKVDWGLFINSETVIYCSAITFEIHSQSLSMHTKIHPSKIRDQPNHPDYYTKMVKGDS